jgi:thiol-disulfide isomerase/thioredoxin
VFSPRSFCMGVVTGAVLVAIGGLLSLQFLGVRWQRDLTSLVRSRFSYHPPAEVPKVQEFPRPWLPETTSAAHEDWRVRDLNGKALTFASLKGRPVFLNFWSTTCAPCISELPTIKRLYMSLKDQHVAFVALTSDHDWQVRNFLKKYPVKLPIYLYDGDMPPDLSATVVPTTYILDASGNAIFRHVGALDWDDPNAETFLSALAGPKPTISAELSPRR